MSESRHPNTPSMFLPCTPTQRIVAAVLLVVLLTLGANILWQLAAKKDGPGQFDVAFFGGPRGRLHRKVVVEQDGKRLLWARGEIDLPNAEWFDVTDSKINPEAFEHGIGKDTIAAIDEPIFLDIDDPRLREAGIDDQTIVIGYAHEGEARAYPLDILDRHELVNDRVGGKPVTVGW